MSEKIGAVTLEQERRPQFMQIQAPAERGDYSERTALKIDCEVRRIIDEQYARVKLLLAGTQSALHEAAKLLLEQEVISGEELKAIMNKR